MFLYHYATEPFGVLMTRRHRGGLTKEEIDKGIDIAEFRCEPKPYYDHISFFFDRPPIEIIGNIFKPYNHDFWFNGNAIYEHIVHVDAIGKFAYFITETPERAMFSHNHWLDSFATDYDAKHKFFVELRKLERKLGYTGDNINQFKISSNKFIGQTEKFYKLSPKVNEPEDMNKYAAAVPHVMLYPDNGYIDLYLPARELIIGKKPPPL